MSGKGGGRWRRGGGVRELLLIALLDGGPAHGYELMERLEDFSGGSWRPSPGSVYPQLQALEGSHLIEGHESRGRRIFTLTAAGRARADERRVAALAAFVPLDSRHGQLRVEMQQLHAAGRQIVGAASSQQVEQAIVIVRSARRALYRTLADQ